MPGAEVGGLQLGQVRIAQALEGLVLAKHGCPVLWAVGDDLGGQLPSTGLLPALAHHAEAAPGKEAQARLLRAFPVPHVPSCSPFPLSELQGGSPAGKEGVQMLESGLGSGRTFGSVFGRRRSACWGAAGLVVQGTSPRRLWEGKPVTRPSPSSPTLSPCTPSLARLNPHLASHSLDHLGREEGQHTSQKKTFPVIVRILVKWQGNSKGTTPRHPPGPAEAHPGAWALPGGPVQRGCCRGPCRPC